MIRRTLTAFLAVLILFALSTTLFHLTTPASAQQELPTLPPAAAPPTFTPAIATLPPPPDATPMGGTGVDPMALPILVAARSDLETLATDRTSSPDRPQGWHGTTDTTVPQFAIFLRLDLESLADVLLGTGIRPDNWFGMINSVPFAVARDIRHDLELLADAAIGASTLRPGGWIGDDPVYRCGKSDQSLLAVIERVYNYQLNIDYAQPNYCDQLENAVNGYVEFVLIQPPVPVDTTNTPEPYTVSSDFVILFADINARQRLGILPNGEGFHTVGRSDSDFSHMMLVSGEGFQGYTDYSYTPITGEEFDALPIIDPAANATFCSADWCD